MKWMIGLISGLFLFAVVFLGIIFTVNDIVTHNYATLSDAKADQLFKRGWLPKILPPSSHNIQTITDLDSNHSSGSFSFSTTEYDQLAAKLKPYVSVKSPFSDFDALVAEKMAIGYIPSLFTDGASVWVFLCKPQLGYCSYMMWLNRH